MLELGNVLNHYADTFTAPETHIVVDKYESTTHAQVFNEDIIGFDQGMRYDCIISISTLEHIGWDETPKDPEKVRHALNHLRSLLNTDGLGFATFPAGYNPNLDALVREQRLDFESLHAMRRLNQANEWEEVAVG